jgi:3',5'-cyclic AMP phosphodiesterase CpdA|tara:strand:- start:845 stop:1699 length:855 start_codon:yes stop_codon:yes gene_type:complete
MEKLGSICIITLEEKMSRKILLMSDMHITEPSVDIIGLDPTIRFRNCLEHASLNHADASHLFLMGDLTHNGLANEYKILKKILQNQPFPTTLMLGNHDRRDTFLEVFPKLTTRFQHGSINFGNSKILYLDTLNENAKNKHGGLMCEDRLQWLEANLSLGSGPIILLAHHHMLTSGFDGMDKINLQNGRQVADIIAASKRCQMVVNGHIHRIIVSTYKGVTHTMIKSPCHQMPMVLGAGTSRLSIAEPGGYGLLLLDEETPLLHHIDVIPSGSGIHSDSLSKIEY